MGYKYGATLKFLKDIRRALKKQFFVTEDSLDTVKNQCELNPRDVDLYFNFINVLHRDISQAGIDRIDDFTKEIGLAIRRANKFKATKNINYKEKSGLLQESKVFADQVACLGRDEETKKFLASREFTNLKNHKDELDKTKYTYLCGWLDLSVGNKKTALNTFIVGLEQAKTMDEIRRVFAKLYAKQFTLGNSGNILDIFNKKQGIVGPMLFFKQAKTMSLIDTLNNMANMQAQNQVPG